MEPLFHVPGRGNRLSAAGAADQGPSAALGGSPHRGGHHHHDRVGVGPCFQPELYGLGLSGRPAEPLGADLPALHPALDERQRLRHVGLYQNRTGSEEEDLVEPRRCEKAPYAQGEAARMSVPKKTPPPGGIAWGWNREWGIPLFLILSVVFALFTPSCVWRPLPGGRFPDRGRRWTG